MSSLLIWPDDLGHLTMAAYGAHCPYSFEVKALSGWSYISRACFHEEMPKGRHRSVGGWEKAEVVAPFGPWGTIILKRPNVPGNSCFCPEICGLDNLICLNFSIVDEEMPRLAPKLIFLFLFINTTHKFYLVPEVPVAMCGHVTTFWLMRGKWMCCAQLPGKVLRERGLSFLFFSFLLTGIWTWWLGQ